MTGYDWLQRKSHAMVLERSFDSADLKRMLARSEMVVDRSLMANAERRHDPANISRPPLPKGSQVFEKVLDEFQVRVSSCQFCRGVGAEIITQLLQLKPVLNWPNVCSQT